MHNDIHYFGTYTMARAAGLDKKACQTIATAAQFVDDNNHDTRPLNFKDGGLIDTTPTAYPILDLHNTEFFPNNQRQVWVPFHFLPGNEGKNISERLVCRKDSKIAREMVGYCLSLTQQIYGLHLVGISAHVYADTFSHYGFSGVSSRWNKVDDKSIKLLNDKRDTGREKKVRERFGNTIGYLTNWRSILSNAAEYGTGALGHGAVLKYPDYPYLKWEFTYEYDGWKRSLENSRSSRDNLATFLDACKRLHQIFYRLGRDHSDFVTNPLLKFDDIRERVEEILKIKEISSEERCLAWAKAAQNGELFASEEEILPYQGDVWKRDLEVLVEETDSSSVQGKDVFRFFQAAAIYRTYIIRDLLPAHGLVLG